MGRGFDAASYHCFARICGRHAKGEEGSTSQWKCVCDGLTSTTAVPERFGDSESQHVGSSGPTRLGGRLAVGSVGQNDAFYPFGFLTLQGHLHRFGGSAESESCGAPDRHRSWRGWWRTHGPLDEAFEDPCSLSPTSVTPALLGLGGAKED